MNVLSENAIIFVLRAYFLRAQSNVDFTKTSFCETSLCIVREDNFSCQNVAISSDEKYCSFNKNLLFSKTIVVALA